MTYPSNPSLPSQYTHTNNRTHPLQVNNCGTVGGRVLVPSPHYTKFAMNKKWWVGQPQGEEEGWDMEGNTEGRGGEGSE